MSARDPDELGAKASSYQGRVLTDRRRNLSIYYEEAMRMVSETKDDGEAAYARKMVDFLENRIASNESLWAIYNGQVEEARTNEFYEISKKSWMYAIPNALSKLEEGLQGPYTFGEQVVSSQFGFFQSIYRVFGL